MLTFALTAALSTASAESPVDYSDQWRSVLAERREAHIERLSAYAAAGRYPINLDQPGPAHMFMDANASRCGMAELIWQSGHEQLVIDTYRQRNDAVMAELDLSDPLTDWVAISGLTMAEVAFIQEPGFMVGDWDEPEPPLIIAVNEDLLALETARRSAHFAMAAQQLAMSSDASLDQAVLALGDKVLSPPEALAWSSSIDHTTVLPTRTARTGWFHRIFRA